MHNQGWVEYAWSEGYWHGERALRLANTGDSEVIRRAVIAGPVFQLMGLCYN